LKTLLLEMLHVHPGAQHLSKLHCFR